MRTQAAALQVAPRAAVEAARLDNALPGSKVLHLSSVVHRGLLAPWAVSTRGCGGGGVIGDRPRQRCDDIGGQRTLLQRGTGWRRGDGRAAAEREDA